MTTKVADRKGQIFLLGNRSIGLSMVESNDWNSRSVGWLVTYDIK